MRPDEFQTIRTVVAYRLLGLTPTYIAGQTGLSDTAVKKLLSAYGAVEMRGRRHWWRGRYAISSETHARLKLPKYIPLSVDKAGGPIAHSDAWMAITSDSPVISVAGRPMLFSFDGPPIEPFHPSQGFDGAPPTD